MTQDDQDLEFAMLKEFIQWRLSLGADPDSVIMAVERLSLHRTSDEEVLWLDLLQVTH